MDDMDQDDSKKTLSIDQKKVISLLEKNLQIAKENQAFLKKFARYFLLVKIWTGLKVLIIVIPIVLGFIYLPPVVRNFIETYKNIILRLGS